jgi:hypothetical protein
MTDADIAAIEQHLQHAEAQMMQAEFAEGDAKITLFQEAKDHLIRAERVMPGSGAWLMSCIHARLNNGEMCIQWLERAKKASMLPHPKDIQSHAHFRTAINQPWFVKWLKAQD